MGSLALYTKMVVSMVKLTPIDQRLTQLDLVDNYEILAPAELVSLSEKLLRRYVEVMEMKL